MSLKTDGVTLKGPLSGKGSRTRDRIRKSVPDHGKDLPEDGYACLYYIGGTKSPVRYNKYLSTGVRWGVSDRETGRRQLGRQQGFDPGPSTEKTCTETVGKEPAPWTGLWRTAARSTWNFSVGPGCCWFHGAPVNCYCAPTRLVPASPFVLSALKHGCRNPPPEGTGIPCMGLPSLTFATGGRTKREGVGEYD